jgi:hypothetical protein
VFPNDWCRKASGVLPKKDFFEKHRCECNEYNTKIMQHSHQRSGPEAMLPSLEDVLRRKQRKL